MNNNLLKTHCANGHPWTPESTYIYRRNGKPRQKHCRLCWKDRNRKTRERSTRKLTLDEKALARLRSAWCEGDATKAELMGRFGITPAALADATRDLPREKL